jgi:hypothetical protein
MNNDEDMTTRRVEIQAKATTNYQYNHPEGLRRPEMSHNSAQQFGPSNTARLQQFGTGAVHSAQSEDHRRQGQQQQNNMFSTNMAQNQAYQQDATAAQPTRNYSMQNNRNYSSTQHNQSPHFQATPQFKDSNFTNYNSPINSYENQHEL